MILLDTNYLIRCLVAGTTEAARVDGWIEGGVRLATPSIAWYEFLSGPVEKDAVAIVIDLIAGRPGVHPLVLEASGCLGGVATGPLATAFDGMGDGEKCLVRRVTRQIVERLYESGNVAKGTDPGRW